MRKKQREEMRIQSRWEYKWIEPDPSRILVREKIKGCFDKPHLVVPVFQKSFTNHSGRNHFKPAAFQKPWLPSAPKNYNLLEKTADVTRRDRPTGLNRMELLHYDMVLPPGIPNPWKYSPYIQNNESILYEDRKIKIKNRKIEHYSDSDTESDSASDPSVRQHPHIQPVHCCECEIPVVGIPMMITASCTDGKCHELKRKYKSTRERLKKCKKMMRDKVREERTEETEENPGKCNVCKSKTAEEKTLVSKQQQTERMEMEKMPEKEEPNDWDRGSVCSVRRATLTDIAFKLLAPVTISTKRENQTKHFETCKSYNGKETTANRSSKIERHNRTIPNSIYDTSNRYRTRDRGSEDLKLEHAQMDDSDRSSYDVHKLITLLQDDKETTGQDLLSKMKTLSTRGRGYAVVSQKPGERDVDSEERGTELKKRKKQQVCKQKSHVHLRKIKENLNNTSDSMS